VADLVAGIETSFGAIQLEDSPLRVFEIERLLQARLQKPVLHDDQHAPRWSPGRPHHAARPLGFDLVPQHRRADRPRSPAGSGIVRLLRAFGVQRVLGTTAIGTRNAARRRGGEGVTPSRSCSAGHP